MLAIAICRGRDRRRGSGSPEQISRCSGFGLRPGSGLRVICPPIERDRHKTFHKMQSNRTTYPRRSAMTMNRFKLLGLALGLALFALSLVPLPAHAVTCGRDSYDDTWIFYSDATHT